MQCFCSAFLCFLYFCEKRENNGCVIVFSVFSVSSVPMRNISIKPFLRNRSMSMEEWDLPKLRQRSFSGSEEGAGSPAKSPAKAANNSTAGSYVRQCRSVCEGDKEGFFKGNKEQYTR